MNGGPRGGDSCRLISIYLADFVKNEFAPDAYFDFIAFTRAVEVAMRLSDDLVDLELEKLHSLLDQADTEDEREMFAEFIQFCEQGRRTGLGAHGLADTLARMRYRYDSDEAIEFVDELYERLKLSAYSTSIQLAKERGAFPIFNWDVEKDCEFFESFPEHILDDMAQYGRRNGALLTSAPTGSVSILSDNCSSGIEPVFRNEYKRRRKVDHPADYTDEMGDHWQEYPVYHSNVTRYYNRILEMPSNREYTLEDIAEAHPLPTYFVTSDQIDWRKRVEMQATITRHLDHSASSTVNLPAGTSVDTVEQLYMEAWRSGCKGITIYVDGSRDAQVLSDVDKEAEASDDREPVGGAEGVKDEMAGDKLTVTAAVPGWAETMTAKPVRPFVHRGDETNGTMFKASFVSPEGEERKVYVYVGTNDEGYPVEAFVTDEKGGEDIHPYAAALGKFTSLALKYGIPPTEIVETLIHLRGGSVSFTGGIYNSVPQLLARRLEKAWNEYEGGQNYEVEGGRIPMVSGIAGKSVIYAPVIYPPTGVTLSGAQPVAASFTSKKSGDCPDCGGEMHRAEGCMQCMACGYSRCS